MNKPLSLTLAQVRHLAVQAQGLHQLQPASAEGMLNVFRQLGCVQLDPISAVAKSHQLVLRSRLAHTNIAMLNADLDQLLWRDKHVFEYWAHCASMVLTEHYPIHSHRMRGHLKGTTSTWGQRMIAWVAENKPLANHILREIKKHGPLPSSYFEEETHSDWNSTGWTSGRNVNQMLDFFWLSGKLMVVGRKGNSRLWDLAERHLPDWAPRDKLRDAAVEKLAALQALQALGIATQQQINSHFTRDRYPTLKNTLVDLEREGRVVRANVEGMKGDWYMPANDAQASEVSGSATLLSPFDNLICDRKRALALFNFDFTIEIYVPKEKRKFGYYVLPILYEDKIIGRVDPLMDRAKGVLHIHQVHAEPDAPMNRKAGKAVAQAIAQLGSFLGASHINMGQVPDGWKRDLR
jgi:uncharacterized protein